MASLNHQDSFSPFEKWKIGIAITLFGLGLGLFFSNTNVWLQWIALFFGLVSSLTVMAFSKQGRDFRIFVRDSWGEMKKVVWPERPEAIRMTLYVFVFVFVMALFLWLTDKTLEWVFYDLLLGWR